MAQGDKQDHVSEHALEEYSRGTLSEEETERLEEKNHQGVAVMNYTEREVPYTRVIEHKHFVFGQQPKTVITREYSKTWKPGDEPYYPVGNGPNQALYEKYRSLAEGIPQVIFGGRLGEYKYYDMDQVLAQALTRAEMLELNSQV